MVVGLPPLSSFVMAMFQAGLFARLCGLNPDSPVASTTFIAIYRFVLATLVVGHQKQRSQSSET